MKHMEEMKIAGLAMALCIVMLGIYIVVPKDGTVSHLTAIPDNNAAELLQILHQRELLMRIFQSIQRTATAVSPRVLTILGTEIPIRKSRLMIQVIILTTAIRIVKPMEQIPRILQVEPVKTQAIMKIRTVAQVKWSMTMITVVLRIRILIAVRPKIPAVMAPMIQQKLTECKKKNKKADLRNKISNRSAFLFFVWNPVS